MAPYSHNCAMKPFTICDIEPETVLLVVSGFILYIAAAHLLNLIVFYCAYTLIPYCVLIGLYTIGSILLFFGVVCSTRGLIVCFMWIMVACLLANTIYVIMLYIDQECLCNSLGEFTHGLAFYFAIIYMYGFLGFMAGVNFVVTLISVLITSDYLTLDEYVV